MRIDGSAVNMQVEYRQTESRRQSETFRVWRDEPAGDTLDFSQTARRALSGDTAIVQEPGPAFSVDPEQVWNELSPRDRTVAIILARIFGIQITIPALPTPKTSDQATKAGELSRGHGWGLEYEYREAYAETEQLNVTANGLIRTADGGEITFSVELSISRIFAAAGGLRIQMGDQRPVDPLVINYGGAAAELAGGHFRFDIDGSGQSRALPLLQPGSGFLALDRNGDGRINSGLELFGPATGDGFTELARFDDDGNHWIDAADSIYDGLRIWIPAEHGPGRLFALGEAGIGAIYLGNIAAPFTYKDPGNAPLARNTAAGLFVGQNGRVGTVQQLDYFI